MQLRLTCSATFSKSPLNFTMYFRPLVKRPQRISTEKMFFFKNGMVGSSSQVKWCLQTKYQLLTRNLKICDGHPTSNIECIITTSLTRSSYSQPFLDSKETKISTHSHARNSKASISYLYQNYYLHQHALSQLKTTAQSSTHTMYRRLRQDEVLL